MWLCRRWELGSLPPLGKPHPLPTHSACRPPQYPNIPIPCPACVSSQLVNNPNANVLLIHFHLRRGVHAATSTYLKTNSQRTAPFASAITYLQVPNETCASRCLGQDCVGGGVGWGVACRWQCHVWMATAPRAALRHSPGVPPQPLPPGSPGPRPATEPPPQLPPQRPHRVVWVSGPPQAAQGCDPA